MRQADSTVIGANGVAIPEGTRGDAGFRTYEVYQRERVGQSTEKVKPGQLVSRAFADDPYPLLATLRENYPCFRDWLSNCFWITRYDDVTSLLTDNANFETRSNAWWLGLAGFGEDLGSRLPVLQARAAAWEGRAEQVAEAAVSAFLKRGEADLASEFAARLALEMWIVMLDIPAEAMASFAEQWWRLRQGVHWEASRQEAGRAAAQELAASLDPLLQARRHSPGADLISAVAAEETAQGPASASDLVATLLEMDCHTPHGALANLWTLLLTHPSEFDKVQAEDRYLKLAVLETFRHSAPILAGRRFARQEVERFGRLIPGGGLMLCSAAAANRDPRIFADPDRFIVGRKDICHREPRGQYRADGLASGICVGLGAPSPHPAVPEDRPRSIYALTRDALVAASRVLLNNVRDLRLADGATPSLLCRSLGEMHTCWRLPVQFRRR